MQKSMATSRPCAASAARHGLVGVPFVLPAGVLAKGGDQVTRVVVVVEFGSQIRAPAGVERLQQRFAGTLPRVGRGGQLAGRDRAVGRLDLGRGQRRVGAGDHDAQRPRPLHRRPDGRDIGLGTGVQVTERVAEQGILFAQARVCGIGRIPQPDEVAGLADSERMADSLADRVGEDGRRVQRPQVGAQPADRVA